MNAMKRLCLLSACLFLSCLPSPAAAAPEGGTPLQEETIMLVNDYRFVPSGDGEQETGQLLCGIRCNALATDYVNLTEPGGWRILKISSGREITVPLGNPFMKGECVCVVDEYRVQVDNLTTPEY